MPLKTPSLKFIIPLLLLGAGAAVWWTQEKEPPSQAPGPPSASRTRVPRAQGNRFTTLTDESIRWQVRVDRLRRLDATTLNTAETRHLYALLRHKPASQHREAWWTVLNEIMEQMRRQAIAPDLYTDTLSAIIGDPAVHPVARDYAVQHLGIWITPRPSVTGVAPHEQNPEKVAGAIEAITAVITEPAVQHTTIPGTALMVLADAHSGGLSATKASFTRLKPWLATTISGTSGASLVTRTSAINTAALMQCSEHLPAIRALVTDDATNDSVRLSSIAALGHLAENDDLGTLRTLADGHSKFKHAAQAALKKLRN